MAVYREGYHAVESLQKASTQIYRDACDWGVPVKKNDRNWNLAKQACEWYGIKSTRKHHKFATGSTTEQYISLMDEWAVSDGRKTEKQATEFFKITYNQTSFIYLAERYDGFIEVEKVTNPTLINELTKAEEATFA